MKVKYVKNIMNMKSDGTSSDTLAAIGEIYEVVSRDKDIYYCFVKDQEMAFMTEEVERILEAWTDYPPKEAN